MHDGTHLACQLVGEGPGTVVIIGLLGDVETGWAVSPIADIRRRISAFSRLLLYDDRGDGRSDPVPLSGMPDLDLRVADLVGILDQLGLDRVAVIGDTDGGVVAIALAALHPERVSSLVLCGTYARLSHAEDQPFGYRPEKVQSLLSATERTWGTGMLAYVYVPSLASDEDVVEAFARLERRSISPGQVVAYLRRAFEVDVRPLLGQIRARTLVVHRSQDPFIAVEHGRQLAELIPSARLVELEGPDRLLSIGPNHDALREIELFLTGALLAPVSRRVVRTVMFVDIVSSTQRLSAIGDAEYARLLDDFDGMARRQVRRFGGELVKSTGDGLLALFERAAGAVESAQMLREGARRLDLEVRIGLHAGEIEVRDSDIAGLAVHVAARVESTAPAGAIAVTGAVRDALDENVMPLVPLGEHQLKGIEGCWALYAVGDAL
jgi:class 3 adenylate cyclase